MSKRIPLVNSGFVIVDDEDFSLASQFKWHKKTYSGRYSYAARSVRKNTKSGWGTEFLHVAIMRPRKGFVVDHIDGNGLNCSRGNMRVCKFFNNVRNRRVIQSNNTSGYKGVSLHGQTGKWEAGIRVNGVRIYLGLYGDNREAAFVFNKAAIKYHGKYAKLNEIKTG